MERTVTQLMRVFEIGCTSESADGPCGVEQCLVLNDWFTQEKNFDTKCYGSSLSVKKRVTFLCYHTSCGGFSVKNCKNVWKVIEENSNGKMAL